MASNKGFTHIAVRMPARLDERLSARHTLEGARSYTAVVRSELENALDRLDQLDRSDPCAIGLALASPHSQSAGAARTEMWLPTPLVNRLRAYAARADVRPGDLLVTLLSATPAARRSARAA